GYYFQSREDFDFNILAPLQGLSPTGVAIDHKTRSFLSAFYGQLRYELGDKWAFNFGLRYDNESFETTGLQATTQPVDPACAATAPVEVVAFLAPTLLPPGIPLAFLPPTFTVPCQSLVDLLSGESTPAVPQSDSFDAVLPRASITYNFTDDISAFFAVQRGYRAGGTFIQQTAGDDGAITIQGTFDPEFLTNFELGLRSQFFDRSLTVNGSVFFSILDDQQVSLPGPTGGPLDFFTDNVGESQIYGLELSVDYQPIEELNLYGSLGLLGSEFTEFPFAVNLPDSPFFDLEGNEPALAPNVTFTIGGSYNHRSGLFADASLNFTGSAETGVENLREEDLINPAVPIIGPITVFDPAVVAGFDETSDSRTVVNLRLGYRHDRFTLSAFATNLFDDSGLLNQNFATVLPESGSLNLFETPNFTLQQPQTFGVQLDVSF
ncbi:MAG: TonB-dependent receptor, partial [Pseudomonadota bacterium]